MYRYIYFLVTFVCFGCASEKYLIDVAGQTMHDNEALIYDNYRHTVLNKKIINEDLAINSVDNNSNFCVESCIIRPLRIAIMPMGYSNKFLLDEIKNTIALLSLSIPPKDYVTKVFSDENIVQDILSYNPDIIVGPFQQSDVIDLKKQLISNDINTTIISLVNGKQVYKKYQNRLFANGGIQIHNMGYSANDDISSIMRYLSTKNYKRYAMLASNDEIGAGLYKTFARQAEANKQTISRVEFYDTSEGNINRHINRLKSAIVQTYYKNIETGEVQEDDYSFAKKITETLTDDKGNKIAVVEKGKKTIKYYQKERSLHAIIIDANATNLPIILENISQNDAFKDILLVASPRTVDALIETYDDGQRYASLNNIIALPSHFSVYSAYYAAFKDAFQTSPTRISTTLYDTLTYIVQLHAKSNVLSGYRPKHLPVFVGVNGTMKAITPSAQRFVNVSIMNHGVIEESVDSYKFFNTLPRKKRRSIMAE